MCNTYLSDILLGLWTERSIPYLTLHYVTRGAERRGEIPCTATTDMGWVETHAMAYTGTLLHCYPGLLNRIAE